ncbi:MAG: NAD(P)/FAD-dependent oxidoreductase [Acetatifactor sp.]|nr:NAD(P)/FAD-dependent oxidoreductase [Acetatifactor sp.]
MKRYDVVVIGAGVNGCAVARELSKWKRRVAVLERALDVCEGTSKANSGIVHAGHDAIPGTLKAKLNVLGNERMEALSGELDFPFKRNGSLVLSFDTDGLSVLEELKVRGEKNGVMGLRILKREEVLAMEPNLSDGIVAALYAPTGGIVCPFGMTIALAENAAENGVDFYLGHEVTSIEKQTDKDNVAFYRIQTGEECFETPVVVNAAGVYADAIHNMVSANKIKITARKGEYCLMDKKVGDMVHSTIFQLPSKLGKGILVTPTVHGNLLVGPTAEDIENKEGVDTTAAGIEIVLSMGSRSAKKVSAGQVITTFAGLRAHLEDEEGGNSDFLIEQVKDAPGFFDVAGMESPGLTCAPAVAEYVAQLVQTYAPAEERDDFCARRVGIPNMALASDKERMRLIAENPAYANVICRCELVTEAEIVEAIHRPVGATTLDGVKRRTRAGMGRCQSGFCSPKAVEILARELETDRGNIKKSGADSVVLTGYTKEGGLQ